MSYIQDLIDDVNKTHKNLGELVAVLQIATKARKMVLIISPSGCGKSCAMDTLAQHLKDKIKPDKLSIAGLVVIADSLNNSKSSILVDDIATTQTDYARKTTITTLVALVYTHRVESIMNGVNFSIEDFYGSAIVGVQPIMLKTLMLMDEWEASIQDKALRYYHLYRPLQPHKGLPDINWQQGIDIEKVQDFEPDRKDKNWTKLIALGESQWSIARNKEHNVDMLKAVAALENREQVISDDYAVLSHLLKPMAIENVVVTKEQLEGERILDSNLLALLTEYYSYGDNFPLIQIARDYKITVQQAYKIMKNQDGNWQQTSKSPTKYRPSDKLIDVLKTFNLELK